MQKSLPVIGAIVVAFGLGFVLSGSMGTPGADEAAFSALDVPIAAQRMWFPPASEYNTPDEPLDDERFDRLMVALEAAMTAEETLEDFEAEADVHLWAFMRRLAVPEVTDEQKERAKAYLEELVERHPDHRSTIQMRSGLLDSYATSMARAPSFTMSLALFGAAAEYDNEGEPFSDAQVDGLLGQVEAILSLPEAAADLDNEADLPLWRLSNRLQLGQINDEQTARIVGYLDDMKEKNPDAADVFDKYRFVVENLIPGNVAPNIVGTDTEGVEFALEDYRGKIIALVFSGQWCGPCRGEYPYQRAMLDIYDEEDVVILGVNSDAKLETIRQAKIDEELPYRTWWDGHSQPDADVVAAKGPIATEWGVTGWPTIYVIDGEGVIRHASKRGGGLLAAVDELLMDKRMREFEERQAEAEADAPDAEADPNDAETDADEAEGAAVTTNRG